MPEAKPSLTRRALAAVVLVVVAVIAIRLLVGVVTALFWTVAIVALLIAAVWAYFTLRGAGKERSERRERPKQAAAPAVGAPQEDRVAAQLAELKQQLRDQGRL